MAWGQANVLRPLAGAERAELERVCRAGSERADVVRRARALLVVGDGANFTQAAHAVGWTVGDTVAKWVTRFNRAGLAVLIPCHGGGPPVRYGSAERERILHEFRRPPDREQDGTATWSLSTVQRALRRAPDGLPRVSTATILETLWEAGYTWQRSRTWCPTGTARRKRKDGTVVQTIDPETTPKKRPSSVPTAAASRWGCRSGARTRRAPTKPSPTLGRRGNRQENQPASRTSTSAAGRSSC